LPHAAGSEDGVHHDPPPRAELVQQVDPVAPEAVGVQSIGAA
jgi:hypothetical protein